MLDAGFLFENTNELRYARLVENAYEGDTGDGRVQRRTCILAHPTSRGTGRWALEPCIVSAATLTLAERTIFETLYDNGGI